MNDFSDQLYAMKCGETIKHGNYNLIVRVPGGWIYEVYYSGNYQPVFVPFNNEFMREV